MLYFNKKLLTSIALGCILLTAQQNLYAAKKFLALFAIANLIPTPDALIICNYDQIVKNPTYTHNIGCVSCSDLSGDKFISSGYGMFIDNAGHTTSYEELNDEVDSLCQDFIQKTKIDTEIQEDADELIQKFNKAKSLKKRAALLDFGIKGLTTLDEKANLYKLYFKTAADSIEAKELLTIYNANYVKIKKEKDLIIKIYSQSFQEEDLS